MKTEPKKKTQTQTGSEQPENEPEKFGFPGLLGIVLIAGALYNVPAILKVPKTTEEQMMLVVVLVMALGGVILLVFGRKKSK
ncbi:MAG: hypothetical protein IJI57_05460 [Flexilinea sp.]|nr:hypothetical protein [Flexilinea sp.]